MNSLFHQDYPVLHYREKELGFHFNVDITSDRVDRNRRKLNVRDKVLEWVECLAGG